MTLHDDLVTFQRSLEKIYDEREAENITWWVFESLTGLSRLELRNIEDWLSDKNFEDRLQFCLDELLKHKPVQYVLGEVYFYKMKLRVNGHVLIPRPETEELVEWVISEKKSTLPHHLSIIDIGTGSGCIAIALKKAIPSSKITAIDISKDALEIARLNSDEQKAEVEFRKIDILDNTQPSGLGKFDILVGNPPYIPLSEKFSLEKRVTEYEPSEALFVPDDDALIFYKAILSFSDLHSNPGAKIYVEVHENFAEEVREQFISHDLIDVEVKKDIYGRSRMVRGIRN